MSLTHCVNFVSSGTYSAKEQKKRIHPCRILFVCMFAIVNLEPSNITTKGNSILICSYDEPQSPGGLKRAGQTRKVRHKRLYTDEALELASQLIVMKDRCLFSF